VAKPEWGQKRICPQCGARYYDMKKKPPVCPQCGATFDAEAVTKTRRARPAPVEEKHQKPAPTPDEIEDLPIDAADSDDTIIEDADELGEDAMDVEDVIDVEHGGEDDR